MGIMAILSSIGKVVQIIFSLFFEKNIEIKKKKKEALDEVKKGIKNKDASSVTAGFDRISRIK